MKAEVAAGATSSCGSRCRRGPASITVIRLLDGVGFVARAMTLSFAPSVVLYIPDDARARPFPTHSARTVLPQFEVWDSCGTGSGVERLELKERKIPRRE